MQTEYQIVDDCVHGLKRIVSHTNGRTVHTCVRSHVGIRVCMQRILSSVKLYVANGLRNI